MTLLSASLGSQHSNSHVPPSPVQATNNCRSLCISYQVAPDQIQAAADLGLHQSLSQEDPEQTPQVVSFRQHQSTTQLAPQMTHLKGGLSPPTTPHPL